MKVNGIIAEYNPFHNGHKYHLEEAKKNTDADYTIIIMSGNFTQRGAPALIDKYTRAEMALQNGADLVIELPMYYASSSAEYFATGAVSLLDKLGVVTNLCFGSECGNLEILQKLSTILLEEPEEYVSRLRRNLKQGMSYPSARNAALIQYDPSLSNYKDVLSTPNNILGIEYLKALQRRNSQIAPYTTMRVGAAYHERRLGPKQGSALAIRQAVFAREDTDFLAEHMPEDACTLLTDCIKQSQILSTNNFSAILHYKLLAEMEQGFAQYLDVSPDLSDRIVKNIYQFDSFQGFCDLLKSKDMTYSRISRCLLHILLGMKKDTMKQYQEGDYVDYARVLGFRKDATPLLSAIKQNSSIPLVTKLADAEEILSEAAYAMLKNDIYMNSIYESTKAQKTRQPMLNEYRVPIVIV